MKKVCTQCGTEFDTVDRGSAAKTCSDECSCERKLKRSREYRRERYATDPEFRERELKRDREKHREINARCRVGRLLVIQDQLKQAMA